VHAEQIAQDLAGLVAGRARNELDRSRERGRCLIHLLPQRVGTRDVDEHAREPARRQARGVDGRGGPQRVPGVAEIDADGDLGHGHILRAELGHRLC
jgi:hypothetical protein